MAAKSLSNCDVRKLLASAKLPALPQSAIQLLQLSQDPDNGPRELAVPIESDPGLTAQVLQFVNSSYFGFAREISNIKMAIMLVGIQTIRNFALWKAVFNLMPNPKCGSFDLRRLWQDSLRRAMFAKKMAELLGAKETEEAFAAALLQDMAVPLLAKEAPEQYRRLLEGRRDGEVRLSHLETELHGWTHAEAAGLICRLWNLPEGLTLRIENHLQLDGCLAEAGRQPSEAAVALSSLLPSAADTVWPECQGFENTYERLRPPQGPKALELLGNIDGDVRTFAPVLKVAVPAKSLSAAYRESVGAVAAPT
jgi:HD-like signal output (HDOD) protein